MSEAWLNLPMEKNVYEMADGVDLGILSVSMYVPRFTSCFTGRGVY